MTAPGSNIIRGAMIVAGLVIILLIFFLPVRQAESPMQSSGSTYGRILVDSPEVYTRERMVNDRFRQEAWLLEQLDKLTGENPGIQGVVAGQSSHMREAGLSLGAESDASSEVTEEGTGQQDLASGQPQLTPIESFRGQQSVREEVRNALIENQLDDRHDLGGNTLYRLKFDATIIPGNDTSAWAQITVRFKAGKTSKSEQELELKELYKRWMSDLQEQVNADYSKEVRKTASDKNTDPRLYNSFFSPYGIAIGNGNTRADWESMLQFDDEQCWELLFEAESVTSDTSEEDQLVLRKYSSERFECLMETAPRLHNCVKDECRQQLVAQDVMGKVLHVYGTTLGQKGRTQKELKKKPSRSNTSSFNLFQGTVSGQSSDSQRFVSFVPSSDSDSILVEEYTAEIPAVPTKLTGAERDEFDAYHSAEVYLVPVELNESERGTYEQETGISSTDAEILEFWETEVGCSDEMVPINVAKRMYRICKSDLNEMIPPSDSTTGNVEPPTIDVEIENDFDGLPYFRSKASDDRILETWSKEMGCLRTASIQVAQREYKICDSWIDGLPRLQLEIDANQGPPPVDAEIRRAYDGRPTVLAKIGYQQFRQKLRKSEEDKFLFSYAVTPRESSQQLASSSRLAVAEQIRASLGAAGGEGFEAGAGRSSLFSEYAQILERRPVVVGIASHPGQGPLDSGDNKSAELGWLIGPKLAVGSDGSTTYRHLPSQNSLSGLVSAPSWWQGADIEIETGWLDDQGEFIGVPVKSRYPIALPGDQEEITSALLLGGKRRPPGVESVEPKTIRIGETAKLLIEGQNLWRSTVVTIGAQRSKRIFVLPNMKGIIAEFDRIGAQETRPASGGDRTAVRVWTSEGVAPWPEGIAVIPVGEK